MRMSLHRSKRTPHLRAPHARRACIGLAIAATLGTAQATPDERRWGDILSVAMPLTTLGCEFFADDRAAAWQYTESLTASLAATEVLKRTTHVERPDKTNHMSFPSGHATGGSRCPPTGHGLAAIVEFQRAQPMACPAHSPRES